ncbi:hypothetical protein JWG44_14010 [Leptospira sp. 201903071]|uniref:hypothetical protein n=1 Tax=Leptospira ainazelensis TaxID=2810034 RepID=UPI001962EF73|nr:hypothetical protein [Leptospira ainazelensis]MBM9501367.1 hypothetical protein [Leptospira ainazelensis]
MKRFLNFRSGVEIYRFPFILVFCCFFLIGIGKLHSAETISQVKILSAVSAEFVKEPNSHSYIQRALKKEDLNGHSHIPGSSFFGFLNLLNPTRWFDREITEDAYDVLLKDVSVLEGSDIKRKLDFVLIRHVKRGRKPEWSWDQGYDGFSNLKKFLVDRPKNDSANSKLPIDTTLWYSDTPVLLSKLSKERKDQDRLVYVGHIHIDQELPETVKKQSVPRVNFGRFGVFSV